MMTGAGLCQILFLRSSGNGYVVVANEDTGLILINKMVNGTLTTLTSKSLTFSSGMVLYAYIEDTGAGSTRIYCGRLPNPGAGQTVTIDQNSTDATWGWIGSQPVYIGLRSYGATANTGIFDNFGGGSLVVQQDNTVVAPPASFTAQSVAPTLSGSTGGGGAGTVPVPVFQNYSTGIQTAATLQVTAPACAVGDAVAVGDLLVMAVQFLTTAPQTLTVTDTQGNVWTRARTQQGVGSVSQQTDVWYCLVTAAMTSADVVTVTLANSSANKGMMIAHFTNVANVNVFDQTQGQLNTAPTTALTSNASPTTTQAAEVVVGVFGVYRVSAGTTCTPGSGFTSIGTLQWGGGNVLTLYMEYQTVTATGAQTATATAAATPSQYVGIVSTYKGATAINITVTAPPASFSGSAVAPVLISSPTEVTPPAVFTGSAVAPLLTLSRTVVAPCAQFNATSVAPAVSGTALVVAPPAFFTMASVAPLLIRSPLVIAPPATFTAQSVGPGLGRTQISPPANFTAGAVGPAPRVDVTLFPNAIGWTANQMNTVVIASVLPNAATFTASSVAPFPFLGVYVFAPAGTWTARSVAPQLVALLATTPAQVTASSAAPTLVKTFLPTPATASYSSVAPQLASTLPAVAARASYSSVAPSFVAGSGMALSVPAAGFVAAATAPATSLLTNVSAAQFSASSAAPILIKTLAVPVAQTTMSSAAPNPTLSPLVLSPVARVTMSAGTVGISIEVFAALPNLTAGASAPILFNVIGVTFGIFTASAPVVSLLRMIPAPAGVISFSSVAGKLSSVIPVPAGTWSASLLTPSFALRVATPAGMLYFFEQSASLDIEKRMFPDAGSWVAAGLLARPVILLSNPAARFTASSTAPILSRGQNAIPVQASFSAPSPTLVEYSPQATYYYTPGDIETSSAWSQWQH